MSLESLRHRLAVGVAVLAVGATIAGWTLTPAVAVLCAAAAAVVGMPHGALDVVVGPRGRSTLTFFASYGALAALVVGAWLAAPSVMLALFLGASWYHFAAGDAEHHRSLGAGAWPLSIATGGAVLAFPLALHADVVAPIFDDLLLGSTTVDPALLTGIGLAMAAVVVGAAALGGARAHRLGATHALIELVSILAVAVVTHPLVAFSIYFACWHSPRHLMRLELDRRAVAPTVAATLGTVGAGLVGWVLLAPSTSTAVQVLFIGLAAVTAPHLIVTGQLSSPDTVPTPRRVPLSV